LLSHWLRPANRLSSNLPSFGQVSRAERDARSIELFGTHSADIAGLSGLSVSRYGIAGQLSIRFRLGASNRADTAQLQWVTPARTPFAPDHK
jgi:hypothetical protein